MKTKNKSAPNILVLLYDGMNAGAVQQDSDCKTPNFDKLAQTGIRFNNAHTVNPVCSPSRTSLMTGLLPHNHGVLQVEHCVDEDQSVLRTKHPHWAQKLQEAGYHTGYFGKWHIERTNDLTQFGWDINGVVEEAAFRKIGDGDEGVEGMLNKSLPFRYQTGPEGYNPVLHYGITDTPTEQRMFAKTTTSACKFIEDAASQEGTPWACCVSFSEPNVPVIAGRESFKLYDVDSIKLPDNLHDELKNSPGLYRREKEVFSEISERQWREFRAVYYALISELDSQFGVLLETLRSREELDNTIIIVSADHGRYIGGHGFDNHNIGAFEEAYKVPMIIAGPGVAKNEQSDAMISLYDLCPTLLELAGAESIEDIDSKSFRKLLNNPCDSAEEYESSYAEYHGTRLTMVQRIFWDKNWKYVFNGFDYDELYDLDKDPYEVNNLAQLPEYQERAKTMMTKIWGEIKSSNDKVLLGTHYAPLRIANVGPNHKINKGN